MEYKFYILIGALVLYMLVLMIFMIRKKRKDKQFELDTPTISKVHLESGIQLRSNEKLRIFSEGIHTGYYFEAGEHTVYVTFYYEKMTKRVTVMEAPITIKIEASKEYDLTYDRKQEQYVFLER